MTDDENPKCCNCEEVTDDPQETQDEEVYCPSCANDFCTECESCSELIHESEMKDIQGRTYCEGCYDDISMTCDNCGDVFHSDDEHEANGDSFCCQECLNDQYTQCYDCEDMVRNDDAYYNARRDAYLCDDCYSGDGLNEYTGKNYGHKCFTDQKSLLDTHDYSIGIELETISEGNVSDVSDLQVTPTEKNILSFIEAKEDGSLSDGGVEWVTSPTMNNETWKHVTALCSILNKNGFDVDNSCGFHLHVGGEKVQNATTRHKTVLVYNIFMDCIFAMLPEKRRTNTYCNPNNNKVRGEIILKKYTKDPETYHRSFGNRYAPVNLDAFRDHQTIEFRAHSGTTNRTKVLNWIKMHVNLVDYAHNTPYREILKLRGTRKEFEDIVLKTPSLKKYYNERVREFKNKITRKTKEFRRVIIEHVRRDVLKFSDVQTLYVTSKGVRVVRGIRQYTSDDIDEEFRDIIPVADTRTIWVENP